jgi:hypothetical protein
VGQIKPPKWAKPSCQKQCGEEYKTKPWFRELINKYEGNFKSAALGCYQQQFDRCCEVATFLNQLLEQSSEQTPRLTLATASQGSRPVADLSMLYALRNHDSHGGTNRKYVVSKFRGKSDQEQRNIVIDGAREVASIVKVLCIPDVVPCLLASVQIEG